MATERRYWTIRNKKMLTIEANYELVLTIGTRSSIYRLGYVRSVALFQLTVNYYQRQTTGIIQFLKNINNFSECFNRHPCIPYFQLPTAVGRLFFNRFNEFRYRCRYRVVND